MKILLFFTLVLFATVNLLSQSDKPKEEPKEKAKEKVVEEAPAPQLMEVKEGEAEGIDEALTEPPPPPVDMKDPGEETVFAYVEKMPVFPDGEEAMYKFIFDNLQYPEPAKKNGISGIVIVQFVVSSDGMIKNAKVVRGIGGGCNEEALRVINAMPPWKPGMHKGKAVSVNFMLPIKFVLKP